MEFLTASGATLLAWRRTRGRRGWAARAVRATGTVPAVGYPLLGLSYVTDREGALVEPLFLLSFSAIVTVARLESAAPAVRARSDRPGRWAGRGRWG